MRLLDNVVVGRLRCGDRKGVCVGGVFGARDGGSSVRLRELRGQGSRGRRLCWRDGLLRGV